MKRGYEEAMSEDRHVRHRIDLNADLAHAVRNIASGGSIVIGHSATISSQSGSSGNSTRINLPNVNLGGSPLAVHIPNSGEFGESPSLSENDSSGWLGDIESGSYDEDQVTLDRFAAIDMNFRNINLYSVSYDGQTLCSDDRRNDQRVNEIELEDLILQDLAQEKSFHNIEISGYRFTFEIFGEQIDLENFAGYRLIEIINSNIEAYSATRDVQDLIRDLPGICLY